MCLYTIKSEADVTNDNIVCYKESLDGQTRHTFYSYFREFKYKSLILYKEKLEFLEADIKFNKYKCLFKEDTFKIEKGFHSYISPSSLDNERFKAIFIIPKNAKFIKGRDNFPYFYNYSTEDAYVSDRIIYIGEYKKVYTYLRLIKFIGFKKSIYLFISHIKND